MTAREKKIWITVGCVAGLALAYNLSCHIFGQVLETSGPPPQLREARRLLGAQSNIQAREHALAERLTQLRKGFFHRDQSPGIKLELLRLVETMASQCGLNVQLKNTVAFSREEIAVSLEGNAPPQTIIAFLQQLTVAPRELQVKRLQLHSVPEQKVLNYRIVVSTLIVD
jgi:hypothetical protein